MFEAVQIVDVAIGICRKKSITPFLSSITRFLSRIVETHWLTNSTKNLSQSVILLYIFFPINFGSISRDGFSYRFAIRQIELNAFLFFRFNPKKSSITFTYGQFGSCVSLNIQCDQHSRRNDTKCMVRKGEDRYHLIDNNLDKFATI